MINPFGTRHLINLVLLAGLIGAPGCASNRLPIPEVLRTETPTIGVVLRLTDPVELQIPGKSWLSNTGRGALTGSSLGQAGIICLYGLIVCVPALATVGAIGGALYGAVAAEPASDWEQAEAVFKERLSDLNIQQRVSDHVVELAQSQTPYTVIRVENENPSSEGEKAAYRALAIKGIDAVLELTELAVHLRPNEIVVNPHRVLMMDARARLIRTSDGTIIDERVITDGTLIGTDYIVRSLATWTDQNAQAFREEVAQAAQRLAQQIVKEFFADTHTEDDVQTPVSQALNR